MAMPRGATASGQRTRVSQLDRQRLGHRYSRMRPRCEWPPGPGRYERGQVEQRRG